MSPPSCCWCTDPHNIPPHGPEEGYWIFALTQGATAGITERICLMAWSLLPEDVAEVVLRKLSVPDMARISTTCPAWDASCCRRLSEERIQLALELFGDYTFVDILVSVKLFLAGAVPGGVMQIWWYSACSFTRSSGTEIVEPTTIKIQQDSSNFG
jgi:hypothetical protein